MNNYDHLIGKNVRMVVLDGRDRYEHTGTLRKVNNYYRVGDSAGWNKSIVSIEPLEFVEGCVATFPNGNKFKRDDCGCWFNDGKTLVVGDDTILFTGAEVTWPERKKFDEECVVAQSTAFMGTISVPNNLVGKKVRVVEL